MAELSASEVATIKALPIENGLDIFRNTFTSRYLTSNDTDLTQVIDQRLCDNTSSDEKDLVLDLILALQSQPAARTLRGKTNHGPLSGEIALLYAQLASNQIDIQLVSQIVKHIITQADDTIIWAAILDLITQTTPAPQPRTPPPSLPSFVSSVQQTPWSFNTSQFANTSEFREHVDPILKSEIEGNLIIDHPHFFDAYFGSVTQLKEISQVVFETCKNMEPPLYTESTGWLDWPEGCAETEVLHWLRKQIDQFVLFAKNHGFQPPSCRRCFTTPNKPIHGSVSKRKLDIGITYDLRGEDQDWQEKPGNDRNMSVADWSEILVSGELKSNLQEDNHNRTWLDLTRYVREIFNAQDIRRFVLGFTFCGSLLRLWEFDRLGGIASPSFDIQKDGMKLVFVMLGYLWMNEEELGFDPSVSRENDTRYLEISNNSQMERLCLETLIMRHSAVVGRATTCWKAHLSDDETQTLIVKDSWQYEERPEEGLLLKKATDFGVTNVARYYYHETVYVGGTVDDIHNVRKGLKEEDGTSAFRQRRTIKSETIVGSITPGDSMTERLKSNSSSRSRNITRKRSSSSLQTSMPPPPKRSCSTSPVKQDRARPQQNRIHRRVVMCDTGKSIYLASSRMATLKGLLGAIKGHESLLDAHILHRDISAGNIMLNEAEDDGFLIDLDLAIETNRKEASGAPTKTGTKIFMAIGALYGEQHSFVHDLESFFWVLFWICVHCTGPGGKYRKTEFESWNYTPIEKLAREKAGLVTQEMDFIRTMGKDITEYYQPLVPWLMKLHHAVFPNYQRRTSEDRSLYSTMKVVFQQALNDPEV
ncbi:MAG: hypothetical protein M1834_008492 [Cirrosporium novae-zelandiae]|nr:MAG: hypothetical protein M1834_008492 [Cirrosporium novae-zelandiae]